MSETDPIYNAPGQSTLAYRITEQSGSFSRMISRLHSYAILSGPNSGTQPLTRLTTRDLGDPAVALLDACAAVFDVLSFYQERIANEVYLRTATEDDSVLQLSQMLAYEPAPALAAGTYLAFTVDGAPNMPPAVTVPQGTQVKSIPGQGQTPQTFETSQAITARALYNQLLPRTTCPQRVMSNSSAAPLNANVVLRFDGVATKLHSGGILSVDGLTTAQVASVSPNIKSSYTDVSVTPAPGTSLSFQPPAGPQNLPAGDVTQLPAVLNTLAINYLIQHTFADSDLAPAITQRGWSISDVHNQVQQAMQAASGPPVLVFRQQVACFGARALPFASQPKPNAYARGSDPYAGGSWDAEDNPDTVSVQTNITSGKYDNIRTVWLDSWGNLYRSGSAGYDIILERSVTGIVPGSYILLSGPRGTRIYSVTAVGDTTVSGYGTVTRATGISVQGAPSTQTASDAAKDTFLTRDTTVYVQGELIPLVNSVPITNVAQDPVITNQITLDSMVVGLVAGQPLLITGQPSDSPGSTQTEVAFLSQATHSGGYTTLYFTAPLSRGYLQSTVSISANVVAATNGETVTNEVLGSGDGSQVNQTFTLKRTPLTYLPAVSASGSVSTLQVRVNGVLWREVTSLLSQDARSPSYVVLRDQSGQASVLFGDGIHGARLPSGTDNVVATYRIGSGPTGQVAGGSLQQLLTRQVGLKGVQNPLPASGGTAAETISEMRQNAPLAAVALGRAVSLSDYEALAGAYPDIAKAQAVAVLVGGLPTVHLTVATADGSPLGTNSSLYQSLLQSLLTLGNPTQSVILSDYQPVSFQLQARLKIDPSYVAANVLSAAAAALRSEYAFGSRSFGQPVYSSDVLATMQNIPGVVGVILDALYLAGGQPVLNSTLTASTAYIDGQGQSHSAELLLLTLADSDLGSLS